MTNHEHNWIEAGAYGHSSGDGSGRLMTINEYCSVCGQAAVSHQSATDCSWKRTVKPERVIFDEDGTPLGTAAIMSASE